MTIMHHCKYLGMLAFASILSMGFSGCDARFYEDCPPDRIVGEWGVVNTSKTFGQYDSLYYVINPIGNINDSVYYNGNYTDSYYHSDPVRVMFRYTVQDSIIFNLDRLYTTLTNPRNVIMVVSETDDKEDKDKDRNYVPKECVLHLRRAENNGNLYSTGPDSLFRELLLSGRELRITATNGASSSEPQGSQNYEFTLFTADFAKALHMADSLNSLAIKKRADMKKDSLSHSEKSVSDKTGNLQTVKKS